MEIAFGGGAVSEIGHGDRILSPQLGGPPETDGMKGLGADGNGNRHHIDPFVRLRLYLKGKGLWSEEIEQQITEAAQKEIDEVVKEAEAVPAPAPEEIFRYVFAEMTPQLKEQLEYLKEVEVKA